MLKKQFFILCSGADKNVLENCSEGEQTKFVGIGATFFFYCCNGICIKRHALFTVLTVFIPLLHLALVWVY
jgi:hypothetical protein